MDAPAAFRRNLAEVERLVDFDKELLQIVTLAIEDLHGRLRVRHGDERMNGARVLAVIRGMRDNKTIRSKYAAIYN